MLSVGIAYRKYQHTPLRYIMTCVVTAFEEEATDVEQETRYRTVQGATIADSK